MARKSNKDAKEQPPVEGDRGDGTNKFNDNEKVLVDNSNMIYRAWIRAKKKSDGGWHYFLHYDGWNKKWDAWVAEDLLMPMTKENTEKMEELNRKTKEAIKAKKNPKKTDENGTSKADRQDDRASKKRKMDQRRELEEFLEPQVRVPIPFILKKTLVDDWEWVTRSNLLVPLPRSPSVQDILKRYLDGKLKHKRGPGANVSLNIHSEFADGLQDYFDRALGTILLYRHERAQYQKFRDDQPKAQASAYYGAEHLLRLFVRLPTLLANTDLSDAELAVLQTKIADFLKFLVKSHEEIFCLKYEPMSSAIDTKTTTTNIEAPSEQSKRDEATTPED